MRRNFGSPVGKVPGSRAAPGSGASGAKRLALLMAVVMIFLMWPKTPLTNLHVATPSAKEVENALAGLDTSKELVKKQKKKKQVVTQVVKREVHQADEDHERHHDETHPQDIDDEHQQHKEDEARHQEAVVAMKKLTAPHSEKKEWYHNGRFYTPNPPPVAMEQLPGILLQKPSHGDGERLPACNASDPTKNGAVRVRSFRVLQRMGSVKFEEWRSASLAVYQARADLVSDFFHDHGEFEPKLTNALRYAFEVLRRSSKYKEEDLFFLDIGSNIGAMAVTMWSAGIRTVAVDALTSNVAMLKYSTFCLNKKVIEKNLEHGASMTVYQSALGSPSQIKAGGGNGKAKCSMVSETDNMGDAMMICDQQEVEALTRRKYRVREVLPLQTLDFLLSEHVAKLNKDNHDHEHATTTKATIVKMDVEGQEWPVIQGGIEALLGAGEEDAELKPKLLACEIWKKFFTRQEAIKYAKLMMVDHGYQCAVENVEFRSTTDLPVPIVTDAGEDQQTAKKVRSPTSWCSLDNLDEATGEVQPCVMTTVEQFVHWLPNMREAMTNIHWVRPEWRRSLTPWTQAPSKKDLDTLKKLAGETEGRLNPEERAWAKRAEQMREHN